MTLLTSDDVPNVKFEITRRREGYVQDEVDEFLDEVTTTLRGLEERLGMGPGATTGSHQEAEILLTSQDVRNIRFKTSKFREGYEQPDVDAFLDTVAATMETMEARLNRGLYGADTSAYGSAPGAYGNTGYTTGAGTVPGTAGAMDDPQHAEAIAQRDQYIAQFQQENAYLRAELESAWRCSAPEDADAPQPGLSPP